MSAVQPPEHFTHFIREVLQLIECVAQGARVYTGFMLFMALFLVLLNGVFVAAEFAFVKVRKTRLELLAEEGNIRAKIALFGVANLDAYLSVCQLGITLASLGLGWLGEPTVSMLLRPVLELFFINNPALVSSISVAVGFILITFLHVIFGELAPKSISIQRAEATVLLLAIPLRVFYLLTYPVVSVMNGISISLLHMVGLVSAAEAEQSHSPEELRMLILDSRKEGQLDEAEGRMLSNIFSFYKKTATDIMVHRTDTVALNVYDSPAAAVQLARESGHTRFPVYDNNRDNVLGFIHAKDLLHNDGKSDLRSLLRVPIYAYETVHLDQLLQLMQTKRQQFCIVVDEYGVWQGVITMEDVVEVIVGDIQDEFDNEEPDFVLQADGSSLISADMSLEDLAGYIPLSCRGTDVSVSKSVAAHILDELGRIPGPGDNVVLCGHIFTVVTMDRHRIRRVQVEEAPEE